MILAAGRGQRLRPLTDQSPKPLLKLHGLALIEIHLLRLRQCGIKNIVINLAHLGHLIEAKLGDGRSYDVNIRYSHENEGALETAGGIAKALPLLTGDSFIVINADVVCDFDLSQFTALSESEPVRAHLLMVANPAHHPDGDFNLENGRLVTRPSRLSKSLTYSGIGLYQRAIFEPLSTTAKQPLAPILRLLIGQDAVTGHKHQGVWQDIGTLERLEHARSDAQVRAYIDALRN